jgi:Leucine-rich repeat (LRR) protein
MKWPLIAIFLFSLFNIPSSFANGIEILFRVKGSGLEVAVSSRITSAREDVVRVCSVEGIPLNNYFDNIKMRPVDNDDLMFPCWDIELDQWLPDIIRQELRAFGSANLKRNQHQGTKRPRHWENDLLFDEYSEDVSRSDSKRARHESKSINDLPDELFTSHIFSHFSYPELKDTLSKVSRKWQDLTKATLTQGKISLPYSAFRFLKSEGRMMSPTQLKLQIDVSEIPLLKELPNSIKALKIVIKGDGSEYDSEGDLEDVSEFSVFESIRHLNSLESLVIINNLGLDESFEQKLPTQFPVFGKLKTIRLEKIQLDSEAHFSFGEHFPNLERLFLNRVDFGSRHIDISSLSQLRAFLFDPYNVDLKDLVLNQLDRLALGRVTSFRLFYRVQERWLSKMPELEDLFIETWDGGFTTSEITAIGHLRKLKSITLRNESSTDKPPTSVDLEQLVQEFSNLPELRYLNLKESGIEDPNMTYISQLSQLEELDVRYTPLNDEGMRNLSQMKNLRKLKITTWLGKDWLLALRQMPKLEYLDVASGKFMYNPDHLDRSLVRLDPVNLDAYGIPYPNFGFPSLKKVKMSKSFLPHKDLEQALFFWRSFFPKGVQIEFGF